MKSTSSTKESIIDGETDFEYETDEDGNVIDPPEDYIPPTSKHSSETTQSSHTGESSQAIRERLQRQPIRETPQKA